MHSVSQEKCVASTDIKDPNNIFEIANEFRVRSVGQSFGRTIYSKQFLQELQKEIFPKLNNPQLNKLVLQRIEEIARSASKTSFKQYEAALEDRFPPSQRGIVKEIKNNAKPAFIKAEYVIRKNLKRDLEKWLQGVLKNQNFFL